MKLALAQMMMSTCIEENLKKTLHLIHEAAERGGLFRLPAGKIRSLLHRTFICNTVNIVMTPAC